jgi:hypothetical protein
VVTFILAGYFPEQALLLLDKGGNGPHQTILAMAKRNPAVG